MAKYPFPVGQVEDKQYNKDGLIKLNCAALYVENLGAANVSFLGRTLATGEGFSLPFSGIVIEQSIRVKFTGAGVKNLYVLQTIVPPCQ